MPRIGQTNALQPFEEVDFPFYSPTELVGMPIVLYRLTFCPPDPNAKDRKTGEAKPRAHAAFAMNGVILQRVPGSQDEAVDIIPFFCWAGGAYIRKTLERVKETDLPLAFEFNHSTNPEHLYYSQQTKQMESPILVTDVDNTFVALVDLFLASYADPKNLQVIAETLVKGGQAMGRIGLVKHEVPKIGNGFTPKLPVKTPVTVDSSGNLVPEYGKSDYGIPDLDDDRQD